MHVQNCLHPITIHDQYTGELIQVPCGQCESCTSARSRSLVTRLNAERQCWKHGIFFTLTYSDNNLPLLKVISSDGYLTDSTAKRVHPILGCKVFNRFDEYNKIFSASKEDISKSEKFISTSLKMYDGVPYVCSLDVQRFIKRLRITIERKFKSNNVNKSIDYGNETIPKVRYFCCSEYGPTTFRPHYHGVLFFNSDWLASNIHEFISSCWKLGITDSSYIDGKAIEYVAKYCNCTSNLPLIYRCTSVRPFALYSKHPALGTLLVNSEVQKELFYSQELYQIIDKNGGQTVVPLLRCLQDKLYPRLSAFSKFNVANLVSLYRIPSEFETFYQFRKFVVNCKSSVVLNYLSLLKDTLRGEFDNKLFRWYSISRRVYWQSLSWNISIKLYVEFIVEYYKKLDYEKLSKWYEFSEKYVEEHSVNDLFCFDSLYAKHLLSISCSADELDATEILYLQSYGIDINKWCSLDLGEQELYRSRFRLDSSDEYMSFKADVLFWHNRSSKTKRKNDYLNAHPNLLKAYGWCEF